MPVTRFYIALSFILLLTSQVGALWAGEWEQKAERLAKTLDSAADEDVEGILEEIGRIGPEASVTQDAVYRLLLTKVNLNENVSNYTRYAAATALVSMGADAIPTVQKGLRNPQDHVRKSFADALAAMKRDFEPVLPDLIGLSKDKNPKVYKTAIETLGTLEQIPPLEML
jgi:HEAT repeat protein